MSEFAVYGGAERVPQGEWMSHVFREVGSEADALALTRAEEFRTLVAPLWPRFVRVHSDAGLKISGGIGLVVRGQHEGTGISPVSWTFLATASVPMPAGTTSVEAESAALTSPVRVVHRAASMGAWAERRWDWAPATTSTERSPPWFLFRTRRGRV